MRRALLGGLISLATTYAASPGVRRVLVKRGSIDMPNHRSSHTQPVPRGGGLACLAGVACGIAATGSRADIGPRAILGVGTLAAVGFADDQTGHVDPLLRLALQAVSGGLLNSNGLALLPAASLTTAGVVNVVNFMDGINGITGSTAAVWGLSTLAAGRNSQDAALQTLGAVTAGAGLGFLPWNVPKAQLFLGDVGSYLFGGLMAAALIHTIESPGLTWRVAAPLLPYGVDAAITLARRAQRGERLTDAHREHTYQRLTDRNSMTHVRAAMTHAAAATAIALVASTKGPSWAKALVATITVGGYVTSPDWIDRLHVGSRA